MSFKMVLTCLLAAVLFPISSLAAAQPPRDANAEISFALSRILDHLREPGIAPGVVIASPSRREPDYFFHWTRDAGLVMDTVATFGRGRSDVPLALRNWNAFESHAQAVSVNAVGGLGEPKFMVNGDVFKGPWGRPQNDGPAIRAWARMKAFGHVDQSVKTDLEYIEKNWNLSNFDLWEEVKGHHFFTRMSQIAAFRQAEMLSRRNVTEARHYASVAARIENSLSGFFDSRRMLIVPTLHGEGVAKPAGLDVAVILSVIYFGQWTSVTVANPYVISTAVQLEKAFADLYPINRRLENLPPGIGRYPEDVYDGNGFSGGHAWFLATFGMAEFYCSLVDELGRRPRNFGRDTGRLFPNLNTKELLPALQEKAEGFIARAVFHAGSDRRYSEQFDRNSGFKRGAADLTWSYASAVRAFSKCQASGAALKRMRVSNAR